MIATAECHTGWCESLHAFYTKINQLRARDVAGSISTVRTARQAQHYGAWAPGLAISQASALANVRAGCCCCCCFRPRHHDPRVRGRAGAAGTRGCGAARGVRASKRAPGAQPPRRASSLLRPPASSAVAPAGPPERGKRTRPRRRAPPGDGDQPSRGQRGAVHARHPASVARLVHARLRCGLEFDCKRNDLRSAASTQRHRSRGSVPGFAVEF